VTKRRILKWIAIALLILILLILCVLSLAYFLLATERGFNITSNELNARVEGLEIGPVSGDLESGINTDFVNYKNDQLSMRASGIESSWRSGCLLDREVCIDNVIINEMNIETFANNAAPKQTTPADILLPDVNLPVSFSAKDVIVRSLSFKPPGDAPIQTLKNVKLSAYSAGSTIHIDQLHTQYENITVNANGKITPEGDYPLSMNIDIDVEKLLDEHDISAVIRLNNSLEKLDINVSVSGAITAQLQGRVSPLDKTLPVTLSLSASELGWPLDTHDVIKADTTALQVAGDLDDFSIALDTKLSGEQIPQSTLKLSGLANTERALLTDITVLTLDGFATGNAAVSWNNGVTWVTDLIAKGINPGVKYSGVDANLNALLRANGTVVDEQWTVQLSQANLDGELRGQPIDLNAILQKKVDDTWELNTFTLNNGANNIAAAGELTDRWDLDAQIELPQLNNLLPDLNGSINANIKMDGELKTPNAVVTANADQVSFQDTAINALALNANIQRGGLEPSELKLSASSIRFGEQQLLNSRLALDGTRAEHAIKLFTDGPEKTSIDLVSKGSLSENFDWNGVLDAVAIEVPAHKLVLDRATPLQWNNDIKKFSVDAHCWNVQDAQLCLKNKILAEPEGTANIELSNYALAQLNPFLLADSTMAGILNTSLIVNWGQQYAGGFNASMDTKVNGGALKVDEPTRQIITFQYDNLSLEAKADGDSVSSKLIIDSNSMGQANLDVSLDPSASNKPISGNLQIDGFKLDFLKAFLPEYENIAGVLSTDGVISGELKDPLYDGTVNIDSLVLQDESLPLSVDGGDISAKITGKQASLKGQLQSGTGQLKLNGNADWNNANWRSDIQIEADNLTIVQDPITNSIVSASVDISATPNNIKVRGDINVPLADINIKEIPSGATAPSDDVIIIEDVFSQTQANQARQNADTAIDVVLTVNLGNKVNLSGYGLNASLTGDMEITQRTPNPLQLGGEIRIVKGTYKQYGQNLTVSDGQILFVGPLDQTLLDIDAVREVENGERIAGLHLDGQLSDPAVTLFTEPADKTQEQILSYIILGRDLSESSDQESNLMASAVLALAIKGGQPVTKKLAESLGLQEISVDARGRGDSTEVVVSGRVNDRLLLRYGRSVFDETINLYLRYDLTKQLYLEAVGGAEQAVDLFYSFSF
jgi:translocation and assembly module TamB